jgi:hypothetical protein
MNPPDEISLRNSIRHYRLDGENVKNHRARWYNSKCGCQPATTQTDLRGPSVCPMCKDSRSNTTRPPSRTAHPRLLKTNWQLVFHPGAEPKGARLREAPLIQRINSFDFVSFQFRSRIVARFFRCGSQCYCAFESIEGSGDGSLDIDRFGEAAPGSEDVTWPPTSRVILCCGSCTS